jgi:hypothetical protein
MDSTTFFQAVKAATNIYRKGEPVIERKVGDLLVPEIYAYPSLDAKHDGAPLFDVHFVLVDVDPVKAQALKEQFLAWLRTYPQPERLAGGPSYSEFASIAQIEQATCFRIFALGAFFDLWKIITPERMGFTGQLAHDMAEDGYVMITGYRQDDDESAHIPAWA